MADKYRFRHGQQEIATYGVALATVIERSDFLFIDTTNNEVLNAASMLPQSTLADTQSEFADLFVGVATESSTSSQSDNIGVDISADAVYEFDATSATYQMGDILGPSDNDLSLTLDDQSVEVAVAASAMAKSFKAYSAAGTTVHLKFASIHNPSANNANATVG